MKNEPLGILPAGGRGRRLGLGRPKALARLGVQGAERLSDRRWAFRFDPQTRAWRRIGGNLKRPNLRDVRLPTLILRGAHSTLVSRWRARSMHWRIKGSVFREIPRAFHHVPLDNPDDTAAAIIDFVRGIERG